MVEEWRSPYLQESRQIESESHVNEVRLLGKVSAAPEQRADAEWDEMWQLRLVVHEKPTGRQTEHRCC